MTSETAAKETSPRHTSGAHNNSPAVVLDEATLTYTVRSAVNSSQKRGLRARLRGPTGVQTNKVEAFKPTSLVFEHGESIGVIGTNGSGKSTMMKLITGELPPTSGKVFATTTPAKLGVSAALVSSVSGEENITLGCLAIGMSKAQVEEKRESIIELSGLRDSLHLPLRAYSSGMASRLQFAIATSVDPEILVMDEALNTGDAQFRERTGQRLDEIRNQAGCVFLVSHSLSTIRQMCSRVIWIQKGTVTMDGDPEEVTKTYQQYTKLMAQKKGKEAQTLREKCRGSLVETRVQWGGTPMDSV